MVVFPDVDKETVVEAVMQGILSRCGQVCIAGSRLLHEAVYGEIIGRLVKRFKQVKLGDTMDADTEIGPLISQEQLERVEQYIEIGKQEGAELLAGGARPDDPQLQGGCFYLPTLFGNVTREMRIAQEEIFGPVLAAIRFANEEEAVGIADDSEYGLAAAVWCNDTTKALRVATRLECGGCSSTNG